MDAETWQKEQISRAFLHAVAAREGCTLGEWAVDKDGVDTTLRRRGRMVDIQLKCTQELRRLGDSYAFDLDVKTYDKLRGTDRSAPGYLFVMIVPRDIKDWIHLHGDEYLLLRCAAFYACIQDKPSVNTSTTTVIHLPFAHRLNRDALERMFEHSRRHALGVRDGMVA
ncbi:DUF4365 domain-containing protein [Micromonospora chokoriensis]|uniref:DUF4365 domain-containing protein n=1 Tax=Micromonospora chokoriensis TaxID=356851 RepID=UPI0004C2D4CE|nr:DUF4365 domain-containing protein [Micromonospora chokoriensis]